MGVSNEHKERALFILDAVLQQCESAGFRLLTRAEPPSPLQIEVDGERFTLRLNEKAERIERAPTAVEQDQARKYPSLYGGRRFYVPKSTGTLQLEIILSRTSYPLFTMRDGKRESLDSKISALAARLRDEATVLWAKRQLAEERAKEANLRAAEQRERAERRKAELEKLKNIEDAAAKWERALRLRRFASALGEAQNMVDGPELVAWIKRAADWLDPLSQTKWPEVDDAPKYAW
jgi:hypothetical protein